MNETQIKKQSYEAPVLKLVELKAEEVLASGCKGAPLAPGPNVDGSSITTCTASPCTAWGS